MKLVPINYDSHSNKTRELLKKILLVVLKLAAIKGYNNEMNIFFNNSYISETNVIDYVYEVFEGDKNVDDRFIALLYRAGIVPEMIFNVNAKEQLEEYTLSSKQKINISTDIKKTVEKRKKIDEKIKPNLKTIKTTNVKLFAPKTKTLKLKIINWEEASDSE